MFSCSSSNIFLIQSPLILRRVWVEYVNKWSICDLHFYCMMHVILIIAIDVAVNDFLDVDKHDDCFIALIYVYLTRYSQ